MPMAAVGALVYLSQDQGIAILVEDCGTPETTSINAGAVVSYSCSERDSHGTLDHLAMSSRKGARAGGERGHLGSRIQGPLRGVNPPGRCPNERCLVADVAKGLSRLDGWTS